ncbi:precorrin-2 C(20)-methyltransferase [Myxacorys almedinensis]|uniref:Precorrin-2 C(20)-methyltransferase n=1 Tax=Myxacorys almedinensis A TaxID=2690445 RepID=A0A8J8CIJ5_9CYAN|nr:precorrin-2 C(20)-methyltransferase [Myxacorys almedinensis]NDJ17749.1 precorrin-2 C(20)-methyltransferase [Myxacorys almedinensis A]
MAERIGTLYGVGVGTSDPELITLKGLRVLQRSQVVAFPAGTGERRGMAETIVASHLRQEQIRLAIAFPYTQDEAVLTQAWHAGAEQVWHYLNQGQDVVFVSEGDVSLYSTFTYLAQALQSHHPTVQVETIPGICSPLASAAVLGIPLTVRRQKLAILPALYTVSELETTLEWADVVVLMKVSSVYPQVWSVLERYHLLERSYVVERATSEHQKIYSNLTNRPTLELPYFSLLIVKVNEA